MASDPGLGVHVQTAACEHDERFLEVPVTMVRDPSGRHLPVACRPSAGPD